MASETSSSGPFGLPRFAVWGAALVVVILVSFLAGWMMGARPIDDLTVRAELAEAGARASDIAAGELESRLLASQALSLLYRTASDVDARNFGTANERLDEAAATLARVDPVAIGPSAGTLETLRMQMEALDLRVADDLEGQRAALAELIQRLSAALES